MNIKNNQKGVVLYMTVVMMSILLSVILGLSTSIIGGLQLIVMIEDSIKSFYAADAGIEKALYNINSGNCVSFSGVFENEYMGSYDVAINYNDINGYDGTISSLGSYDQSRKKIIFPYILPDIIPSLDFSCGDPLIVDCHSGEVYQTALIGSQCWMTENLKYIPEDAYLLDGLPEGREDARGYYVYGYTGYSISEARNHPNYSKYGVLYNWYAAIESCPTGWHLPSDSEWLTLERFVCNSSSCSTDFVDCDVTTAGSSPEYPYCDWHMGTNEGATLKNLLNIKMAGQRSRWDFSDIDSVSYFWTSDSSAITSYAYSRWFRSSEIREERNEDYKFWGYSVRCVKD